MVATTRATGSVAMEVTEPRIGASDRATVLYLHGGGYALGSAGGYRGLVGRLAEAGALRAVSLEYSRSPEAPFPTALYEARDAYRQLLEDGIEPHRIVVAGDSAGGGLALALVMLLRDEGAPLPAALGLICPWLNLASDAMGTRIERHDPLISTSMTAEWVRAYAGDTPCEHPGISPVLGKVNGLPPIVLHSARPAALAVGTRSGPVVE